MESLFAYPAAYFGDLADSIDTDLHERLKEAIKRVPIHTLQPEGSAGKKIICRECGYEQLTCLHCGARSFNG